MTEALPTENYLVVPFKREQWIGTLAEWMGLEPRVLPTPLPGSRESKKAARFAGEWRKIQGGMLKDFLFSPPPPDEALKLVQDTCDTFYNRYTKKPLKKLQQQPENCFDPGAKFMRAIVEASSLLFDPGADRNFPNTDGIERLGSDLVAFHEEHNNGFDPRFMPIRAMGQCLLTLVSILRQPK